MAKTQWHPAFCAAMRLELKDNPSLQFTNEFNLTEKPLEVDLLIINKPSGTQIDNMIGEFFGEHCWNTKVPPIKDLMSLRSARRCPMRITIVTDTRHGMSRYPWW